MKSRAVPPAGQQTASPEAQMDSVVQEIIQEERQLNDMRYAPLRHGHPEFKRLEESVAKLILTAKKLEPDLSKYALKEHVHPEHIHPLDVIERGNELKKLLNSDPAPRLHKHAELENKLQEQAAQIDKLQSEVDLLRIHVIAQQKEQNLLVGALDQVRVALEKINASIPVLPKDNPEIIGSRFCLVPFRCDGKRVQDMLACDYEGNRISVTVKHGSNTVAPGYQVKVGDLFILPPNCIVLFRFQ